MAGVIVALRSLLLLAAVWAIHVLAAEARRVYWPSAAYGQRFDPQATWSFCPAPAVDQGLLRTSVFLPLLTPRALHDQVGDFHHFAWTGLDVRDDPARGTRQYSFDGVSFSEALSDYAHDLDEPDADRLPDHAVRQAVGMAWYVTLLDAPNVANTTTLLLLADGADHCTSPSADVPVVRFDYAIAICADDGSDGSAHVDRFRRLSDRILAAVARATGRESYATCDAARAAGEVMAATAAQSKRDTTPVAETTVTDTPVADTFVVHTFVADTPVMDTPPLAASS